MDTTVTLIYPNGGENLKVGDQVHIQWSSSGATAQRVQYSLDGSSYTPIVTGLSGSAQDYLWTIPKDVLPGGQSTVQAWLRVVTKGDGDEAGDTSNSPFTISALPAPVVQEVSPGHGPLTGGTTITVTGQNFVSGCKVRVGGADATGVSILGSGQLTAVTPPHLGAEAVGVHVVNPDG